MGGKNLDFRRYTSLANWPYTDSLFMHIDLPAIGYTGAGYRLSRV